MDWVDWAEIAKVTDEHGYMSGVDRMSERVKQTGEVFTPTSLVIEILQKMPIEAFAPGKTVIDPSCGDGQFLVPVKLIKMYHYGMSETDALNDIYGVDIMRDNVDLCKSRLGGGNIVMGNTLDPNMRLEGQTDEEYQLMQEWFGCDNNLLGFFE
jgi:type I restriction-modification system DNA methylase subunit